MTDYAARDSDWPHTGERPDDLEPVQGGRGSERGPRPALRGRLTAQSLSCPCDDLPPSPVLCAAGVGSRAAADPLRRWRTTGGGGASASPPAARPYRTVRGDKGPRAPPSPLQPVTADGVRSYERCGEHADRALDMGLYGVRCGLLGELVRGVGPDDAGVHTAVLHEIIRVVLLS